MPESMTRVGVAAGKHEIEYEGDNRVIYDAWDLSTYDPNSDGTGNAFDPEMEYGFSRVKSLHVYVADGSVYDARYDHAAGAVRLYNRDGTGEVGNNTTVDVTLRVEVRGNG